MRPPRLAVSSFFFPLQVSFLGFFPSFFSPSFFASSSVACLCCVKARQGSRKCVSHSVPNIWASFQIDFILGLNVCGSLAGAPGAFRTMSSDSCSFSLFSFSFSLLSEPANRKKEKEKKGPKKSKKKTGSELLLLGLALGGGFEGLCLATLECLFVAKEQLLDRQHHLQEE